MLRETNAAAAREWKRITARRLYLVVAVILPLFCLFFMATIFGNGQMEQIPIGIVDLDDTAYSRNIARRMEAVPTFKVTSRPADEAEARRLVLKKEIYAYLVIPNRFERKAVTGNEATLPYYYHYALLSVGGEVMAAFESSLAGISLAPIVLTAEALGVEAGRIETFLLPIEADMHPLYNPGMDYSIYLTLPFYYILVQILLLLLTVYAIGSEFKEDTAAQWLQTAGGNILAAVVGKLLPYTLCFATIALTANFVFFFAMHIPLQGSLLWVNILSLLFLVATQSLGVLLFALVPKLSYVISGASMIGSLGATLSGVTFPVTSMYGAVRAASLLFPVRHFTEAVQGVVYFGAGFADVWQQVSVLLLFLLAAVAALPLLRKAPGKAIPDKPDGAETALQNAGRQAFNRSLPEVMRQEWYRISRNPSAVLVLAGGVFLYGLLYNYMYAPNVVRDAPLAVVDASHSSLGREYTRWIEATPQVSVAARTPYLSEARRWMREGSVKGILYLPRDFENRVKRGESSAFVLYAATDAFLTFKGMKEAASRVMLALCNAHRADGAVFLPPQGVVAVASSAPVGVMGTAVYNPTEGYGSYLIPAVLIVILFQTMFMVVAMLQGEAGEERRLRPQADGNPPSWRERLRVVAGRSGVHVMLYGVFSLFLLGLLPRLFAIPHQASAANIVLLLIPFLLATSLLVQSLARWCSDSEAPLLCIAYFSVGYIFLSGVSYPLELMPKVWLAAHHLLPAAPAVLAFVKLNSMGATVADTLPQLLTLWAQVVLFGFLAVKYQNVSR